MKEIRVLILDKDADEVDIQLYEDLISNQLGNWLNKDQYHITVADLDR